MDDPTTDPEWRRFRWDRITGVVNAASDVTRAAGRLLTAAVFPTPRIARTLVRQDWPNWRVDALLPMLYHSFYEQPVEWIEQGVREGVEALAGRIPLYAGLYVPELDPEELGRAVRAALDGGASGVSLFESRAPTEAHWQALERALAPG